MNLKKMLSSIIVMAMLLSTMSFTAFAEATVFEVKNDTELAEAIKGVVDGDTIRLAAGNYTGGISVGKNIILEGSVDDDGNPTTVFSGGNPAIYISKGTVKNIKITDAFKGFYGEPCGDVLFDNVHMTGVTYGFHLVAYSDEPTWTIKNCYVDASWANSFGTYECEGATIIVCNNEFVSTKPYYDDGSGAPLVNTFSPKTTIEDNIFGANAKILIRDSAKDGAEIGPNYYEDGFQNALYEDCAEGVKIETYYADREMTEIRIVPVGTITPGYVSLNDIWGELTTNATQSVEIEIYANDEKIAKTTLNNIGGIIDGDVYVTWHNDFVGNFDEYWTTEWYNGNPAVNVIPTKVVLVADGIAVAENVVKMCGPDDLNPVVWEELEIFSASDAADLPIAEVTNLGAITITDYDIYNGSLVEGTEPIDLQIAMEFIAQDTPEEAEENAFADYTTDFFIEISNLSSDSFIADGCYLAGHYGDWGWIQVPLDGMEIENGKVYPVITSVGFDFSYVDICTIVKDFKCGIYLTEEVLNNNPDIQLTLTLGLSKDKDAALAGDFITVDDATYFKSDFYKQECNWVTDNDSGFYYNDSTKFGMIRFLFAAEYDGEIEEYGIKYSKADDITEDVTTDAKTVSDNGDVNAFYGDLYGVEENADTRYYAIAFIKVNGKYLWSDIVNCTPNWSNNYSGYTGGNE